jgi:hypothetical protein
MASPSPATADSSPSSPEPETLETYLLISIFHLVHHADNLFSRYKAAGVKYHSVPYAVRESSHLGDDVINMLDEVYLLTTDSRLADCVAGGFADLISCIAEADRALKGDNKNVGAADNFVFDAFNVAEKWEKRMYATEAAVADVVAIRNSLTEQGLVPTPDPWADEALQCFGEWAEALFEWTKEMTETLDEIWSNLSGDGMEAIFGFGA